MDPAEPFTTQLRGLDEIEDDDIHRDRARQTKDAGGLQNCDDGDHHRDRCPEERQQQEGKDELRDRHQHINDPGQELIDPVANRSRNHARPGTKREGEAGGQDGDADGVACTVKEAGQHIPAEIVGAEQQRADRMPVRLRIGYFFVREEWLNTSIYPWCNRPAQYRDIQAR